MSDKKTMMRSVLKRAKKEGFKWYKDNGSILLRIDEMLGETWFSVDDPTSAKYTISDYNKQEGKAGIYKVDQRGFLRGKIADIWKEKPKRE